MSDGAPDQERVVGVRRTADATAREHQSAADHRNPGCRSRPHEVRSRLMSLA